MIEYYNHPTYNDKWIIDLYKGKRKGYWSLSAGKFLIMQFHRNFYVIPLKRR